MTSRPHSSSQGKGLNCVSQREHFNYLRNNSCGVSAVFTWGDNQAGIQDQRIDIQASNQYQINPEQINQVNRNRRVSFDDEKRTRNQSVPYKSGNVDNTVIHEANKRNKFERKSKITKDEETERHQAEQKRVKVQNYIAEQKPYTRGLTNSKFQQYYGKAAPECYGRANINEPIGGIIYGNHLKTFNVNPHAYTNKPEYYQTHTTALNYGKRTRISDQERWKRLERQLSKKLGLKQKNQTLKEGKQVNYVDVDDTNMYQAMRENLQFQKANREEIHRRELQFKKQKQQEHIDDINQYNARKQELISAGISNKNASTIAASDMDPEEYEAKLNQQNIYRYHDKNGNVRLGADRHALTCFVDLNFPENDPIYTQELKNRMPIYPTKCEQEDRNIDGIRRQNYEKRKEEPYPSHYLLRNCEEPQVLKMLSEKVGTKLSGRKTGGQNEKYQLKNSGKNPRSVNNVAKTTATTAHTAGRTMNNRSIGKDQSMRVEENLGVNKSEMLNQAWNNSQLAGDISAGMSQSNCCKTDHLPHNEKNPQCYRNTNIGVSKIPFAG